jgi:hypothetical protein
LPFYRYRKAECLSDTTYRGRSLCACRLFAAEKRRITYNGQRLLYSLSENFIRGRALGSQGSELYDCRVSFRVNRDLIARKLLEWQFYEKQVWISLCQYCKLEFSWNKLSVKKYSRKKPSWKGGIIIRYGNIRIHKELREDNIRRSDAELYWFYTSNSKNYFSYSKYSQEKKTLSSNMQGV